MFDCVSNQQKEKCDSTCPSPTNVFTAKNLTNTGLPGTKMLWLESEESRSSSSIEECLDQTEFPEPKPANLYKIHPGCTGGLYFFFQGWALSIDFVSQLNESLTLY